MDRYILDKFFSDEADEQEIELISSWVDESEENRSEFQRAYDEYVVNILAVAKNDYRNSLEEIKRKDKQRRSRRILSYAASVAASLVVGGVLVWNFVTEPLLDQASRMLVFETEAGQRATITLGDGTSVVLNSGTRLEYPAVFSRNERRVKIEGEAMFDVTPDSSRPFFVETFAYDVQVLGTKFNVLSEPSSSVFSTALLFGKVRIVSEDQNAEMFLSPGEKAELVNGRLRRSLIANPDDYLWTEGIINLSNSSFTDLLKRMEKAYDIRFIIQRASLPQIHCKGKIRISDGVEHAMEILKLGTDFEYEINHSLNEIYIR